MGGMSFPAPSIPIAQAPVVQDPTTNQSFTLRNGISGPFFLGGSLYMVGQDLAHGFTGLMKSADGGNGWGLLVNVGFNWDPGAVFASCPILGGAGVWIGYCYPDNSFTISTIDLVSETSGSSFGSGLTTGIGLAMSFAQSANGILHIAGIGADGISYRTFDGAAYSSVQMLSTSTSSQRDITIFIDANDNVRMLAWIDGPITEWVISNTGAILSSSTVATAAISGFRFEGSIGSTTQNLVMWSQALGGSNIAIGAFGSVGGGYASAVLSSYSTSSGGHLAGCAASPTGAIIALYSNDTQLLRTVFTAGSPGTPAVVYDRTAFPPTGIANSGFNTLGLNATNDGTTTYVVFSQGTPDPGQFLSFREASRAAANYCFGS
jgi:hypothetical protein